jgi:hypothetical protein
MNAALIRSLERSTSARYRSEDAAVFPAASLARTEKVGNPSVSPV